jgi:hypothetical protein
MQAKHSRSVRRGRIQVERLHIVINIPGTIGLIRRSRPEARRLWKQVGLVLPEISRDVGPQN